MSWPLLKFVWQRRCNILFSTLMFMPVVPAILTRNERHCSSLRYSCTNVVCYFYVILKKLSTSIKINTRQFLTKVFACTCEISNSRKNRTLWQSSKPCRWAVRN